MNAKEKMPASISAVRLSIRTTKTSQLGPSEVTTFPEIVRLTRSTDHGPAFCLRVRGTVLVDLQGTISRDYYFDQLLSRRVAIWQATLSQNSVPTYRLDS